MKRIKVALVALLAVTCSLIVPTTSAWTAVYSDPNEQAASQITTMSQLEAANPQEQAYVQTATQVSESAIVTQTGSVPAGTAITTTPNYPCGGDGCGWRPAPTPGCYTVQNLWTWKNVFGWSLFTLGYVTTNWCWNGSRDTTSPGAYAYASTHWGWEYCGNVNFFNGWVSQNWGWQTSGDLEVGLGQCVYPDNILKFVGGQYWGNGHYNWWANG